MNVETAMDELAPDWISTDEVRRAVVALQAEVRRLRKQNEKLLAYSYDPRGLRYRAVRLRIAATANDWRVSATYGHTRRVDGCASICVSPLMDR